MSGPAAAAADDPEGLASRRAACRALDRVERDGAWSTRAVPAAVGELAADRDRSLASHLAYDTLRWRGTLDWALGTVLDRPLAEVDEPLVAPLRLGALQLLRTDVPAHAAVSTAVELARERTSGGAAGFVNGVLRSLSRQRDALPWPDPDEDPVGHLRLTTAHPAWVVEELLERHDRDEVAALLGADNDPADLTLRATGDRAALLEELRSSGLEAAPTDAAAAGVVVPGADPRRIDAVAEGRAVVQDEASMLVVEAAGVEPGERVLDACAGPGGKATHLAGLAGPDGLTVALEIHPHRARQVAAAAARRDVPVAVVAADATAAPLRAGAGFDVVLVDAPCTGLGTGRRRPEIRWRRTPGDLETLPRLQSALLEAGLRHVRPGGRVVYAACTWTAAETTAVTGLAAADPAVTITHQRQLLPHVDGTDGMYLAVLERAGRPAADGHRPGAGR